MNTKWNLFVVFVLLASLIGGTASTAQAQETNYISWSPAAPQEGGGWVYFTTTYPAYVTKKWGRSTNPGGTACDQEIGWDDNQSEFWQSGDYLICLTIYPTWNFEDAISYTQVMNVTNLPPTIGETYASNRGGLYYHVTTEITDWDSGVTCTVDYGDGTGPLDSEFSGWYCYGPDHEYAEEGTYDVVTTLYETGFDPVISTYSLEVLNNTFHIFTWTPASPVVDEDVTFSLSAGDPPPGNSVVWTRSSEPGGTVCDATIGTEASPVISFAAAGDYKVCLVMSYDGEPVYYDNQAVTVAEAEEVPYQSGGFTSPVDLGDVINLTKAGQMIPLKWMLLDSSGAPVTDLDPASVTITVSSFTCESGVSTDAIEVYAAGGSGLQNLGDGYYQYNWKTLKTYADSCRQLTLNIGTWSGSGFTAKFQFKK